VTISVAVLGLGEAGGAIARDLVAAGAVVRAYDPAVPASGGMVPATSEADAATGADLVLSVNSAKASPDALRAGIPGLVAGGRAAAATPEAGAAGAGAAGAGAAGAGAAGAGAAGVWADLNTASPGTKRRLAEIAEESGIAFADVSIMAPVPGRGLRTPMLISGPAAAQVARILTPLGASVQVLDGPPGLAAERKLLRSVFFKGLAAAVVEALAAARAVDCEDWLRENIAEELSRANAATVDRLVSGTHRHAVRRADEMSAATDMLAELGVEPTMSAATRDFLTRLATTPMIGASPK
jgi:3-hydroxyisobutyrate dehydrogenase-like beta-hydroxyacid dehydrogenase